MKLHQLKELVRQVVREEEDYQQLFKHMLDKSGKSIPSMSDDEKKKFFNAVDTAYKAKSEGRLRGYNENLPGNQEKLDTDKDGEIEASDLAALRASKNELKQNNMKLKDLLNEARDSAGNEYPEYDDVKAAVRKVIQSDEVERTLRGRVVAYLQKERGFTGANNTNSQRLYDKVINDLLKN